MVAQTSYSKNISGRIAGLIYDIGNTNIDSFAAEGVVNHGRFVSRGTDPENQCVQNGSALPIGVSIRHASENDYKQPLVGVGSYEDLETVGVLRDGFIWCQFDAVGGTVDAAVTLAPGGIVKTDGTGVAITTISAYVERPAIDIKLEGQGAPIFVGLVRISAK